MAKKEELLIYFVSKNQWGNWGGQRYLKQEINECCVLAQAVKMDLQREVIEKLIK